MLYCYFSLIDTLFIWLECLLGLVSTSMPPSLHNVLVLVGVIFTKTPTEATIERYDGTKTTYKIIVYFIEKK